MTRVTSIKVALGAILAIGALTGCTSGPAPSSAPLAASAVGATSTSTLNAVQVQLLAWYKGGGESLIKNSSGELSAIIQAAQSGDVDGVTQHCEMLGSVAADALAYQAIPLPEAQAEWYKAESDLKLATLSCTNGDYRGMMTFITDSTDHFKAVSTALGGIAS